MRTNVKISFMVGSFVILFVAILVNFLTDETLILTTDAAIAGADKTFLDVFSSATSGVNSRKLIGTSFSPFLPGFNAFLKGFFPSRILWNNWSYSLGCFLASMAFIAFLWKRVGWASAVALASISAFWVGSNFTLLYAGHIHKSAVVLFFTCALLFVAQASAGSVIAGLLWGACVGLMFAQQPDIAMFFALFAGSYLLFSLWKEQGFKPLKWVKILFPAAVVAFLFAAGPLLSGYERHVKGSAQMQTENKPAKWDYVTQWSFPPEETIAFVAPGYTGWRSGEPEGAYWGRMGRSAGWEETGQGFRNFKLENTYLGIIPVAFSLFALVSCRRSKHRAEILFWSGAAFVALMLSYGKFTPLYKLFYQLPVVNSIRNPNKFLQVFQICLAIMTAYGMGALFCWKLDSGNQKSQKEGSASCLTIAEVRWFFWGLVAVLVIFLLAAIGLSVGQSAGIQDFISQGWPQEAAAVMQGNKITALWHVSIMVSLLVAVFAVFVFPKFGSFLRFKNWIAAALVLIVALDAIKLSKHYVKEMPLSYIKPNMLTDFLKKDVGNQRVALLSQQGIYGIWTTYLLPYNGITTFNFSDMPRMATDYKMFLEEGQKNPLNMWRFSSVKYLLGPSAVEKQLGGQVRKVMAYDLAAGEGSEFRVVMNPQGAHAVYELLNAYPRYAVVAPIAVDLSDEQSLAAVGQLPRQLTGSVEVLSSRSGKIKLKVQASTDSTLRIADKWSKDWKARIDGQAAEVRRVDFICQGVDLPQGKYEVILHHAPRKHFMFMQLAGYIIFFGALGVFFIRRKKGHAED